MPSCSRFSLAVAVSFLAGAAYAEGPPLGGRVFNLELNQRIHYSCKSLSDTELECDFTEATVSQVLPADQIDAYRAEQLKQSDVPPEELEEFSKEMCEAVDRLDAAVANGEADEIKYMPEADREKMLKAFADLCEKRDKASLEAFVDFDVDVKSRTCMVSTFGWKARFVKSDEKTWVRTDKDAPNADGCAGVYLDRLELAEEGYLWNLTRLSVATNPNGTFTTGQQCSEVYTGKEVNYNWQGGDLPARCDYIRLNLYD
jgi:hypothetical protein